MSDPEPQPGDGPDFHTEHNFWVARQVSQTPYDFVTHEIRCNSDEV